jgi:hypothetical protein
MQCFGLVKFSMEGGWLREDVFSVAHTDSIG